MPDDVETRPGEGGGCFMGVEKNSGSTFVKQDLLIIKMRAIEAFVDCVHLQI